MKKELEKILELFDTFKLDSIELLQYLYLQRQLEQSEVYYSSNEKLHLKMTIFKLKSIVKNLLKEKI